MGSRIGRVLIIVPILGFCWTCYGASVLTGQVLDDAAQPLAAASVWFKQGQHIERQESDEAGRFRFAGVGTHPSEIVAYKQGYAVGGHWGLVLEDTETEIILGGADALRMRVFGTKGEYVAGAEITTIQVGESFPISVEALLPYGFPMLRSNDEGDIQIDFLPTGAYASFVLRHLDYVDTDASYLPVREQRHNIMMTRGVRVRGQVLFGEEGVSGASVSVFQSSGGGTKSTGSAFTDEDGLFVVRLAVGQHYVVVEDDRYASPEAYRVAVSGGEDSVWVPITMLRARTVTGSIRYSDDRAGAGVRVGFRWGDSGYVESVSDEAGGYTMQVGADAGVVHVAPPAGFMTAGPPYQAVTAEEDGRFAVAPFSLQPLPEVSGVILDEAGAPAGQVLISSMVAGLPAWTLTDDAGAFSLGLLGVPDSGEVRFRAEHGLRFQRQDFVVNVKEETTVSEQLRRFAPDASQWPARPGANDLSALVGEPAPAFSCDTWINGEAVTLEGLRGKVVVLLFWAGFARDAVSLNFIEELRALDALYKGVDDVAIIGIHDAVSTQSEVASFVRNAGIEFLVGRDADPIVSFDRYGINFIPQIALIDRQGVFRHFRVEGRLLELIKVLRREG